MDSTRRTAYAVFEIWGGGAPETVVAVVKWDIPTGGSHGQKALDVEAGQQITICAAGPNVL